MSEFNRDNRTKNVIRSSGVSTLSTGLNILLGFAYRTVFIKILSENYLGISGLFTNILTILSLTELGITDALNFRLYEPINRGDTEQVGRIMHFYRKVYLAIAGIILLLGLSLLPFLNSLIKDTSEVPADVNLKAAYLLFLLQSVVSYTYAYKQMLLAADQRQHVFAAFQSLLSFVRYAVQLLVLLLFRDYMLTLACGILVTLLINWGISFWTSRQYKEVFLVKESITKEERQQIFVDTGATLCHKIGGVVLTGTDNLIVTKFVGLAITGIYSNYSMLLVYTQSLLSQLLGSFTGSLGSAHTELGPAENHAIFCKMQFVCFWLSSVVTVCIYTLINDFISVWIGSRMLLDNLAVAALASQFYLETDRRVIGSYTNASGLFVKDKWRPLVEAVINIIVSIWLVLKIGVAGVFFGTVISHLCTISWRAPYILYKHEFKAKMGRYWLAAFFFAAVTAGMCAAFRYLKTISCITISGFGAWVLEAVVCFAAANAVLILLLCRTEEFHFFVAFIREKWKHLKLKA